MLDLLVPGHRATSSALRGPAVTDTDELVVIERQNFIACYRALAEAAPVGAVRETKTLLLGAAQRDLDTQRRLEREAQIRRFRELAALSGT